MYAFLWFVACVCFSLVCGLCMLFFGLWLVYCLSEFGKLWSAIVALPRLFLLPFLHIIKHAYSETLLQFVK